MPHVFDTEFPELPRLVVFDVDYTLWPYWVDTHLSAPFTRRGDAITDARGRSCRLFPEVPAIVAELQRLRLPFGLASRTGDPPALEALAKLLDVGGGHTLWSAPAYREIYRGSKIRHFERIQQQSGVPCAEMLFFDDEPENNSDVCTLGVTLQAVPTFSERGLTKELFLKGL